MSRRVDLLGALDPTRTTPRHRPGAVYLLPHQQLARFKVGWSQSPLKRIQQLPEFEARVLDLAAAQVAWFTQASRAHEVEQVLHRCLAPFSVQPGHFRDGHTEWFNTQGLVLARRMLSWLPAQDDSGACTQLLALADAPKHPTASPMVAAEGGGAMDTWYRVEDLWMRLGMRLPQWLQCDRDQRWLYWLGLRRMVEPDSLLMRSRALNLETYQWHEDGKRRSLVMLMDWERDDLLLQLMPTRQLQRWADGELVADLLKVHLARHAQPMNLGKQAQGKVQEQEQRGPTAWR